MLTPQQVSWLTAAQIQTLTLHDFQYLSPSQTPLADAGAESRRFPTRGRSPSGRPRPAAALTRAAGPGAQGQARVRLTMLTPQQVSWLTAAQIQSLTLHDFQYLSPVQIPLVDAGADRDDSRPGTVRRVVGRVPSGADGAADPGVAGRHRATWIDAHAAQVSWLTVAQIQTLTLHDFKYLSPARSRC